MILLIQALAKIASLENETRESCKGTTQTTEGQVGTKSSDFHNFIRRSIPLDISSCYHWHFYPVTYDCMREREPGGYRFSVLFESLSIHVYNLAGNDRQWCRKWTSVTGCLWWEHCVFLVLVSAIYYSWSLHRKLLREMDIGEMFGYRRIW